MKARNLKIDLREKIHATFKQIDSSRTIKEWAISAPFAQFQVSISSAKADWRPPLIFSYIFRSQCLLIPMESDPFPTFVPLCFRVTWLLSIKYLLFCNLIYFSQSLQNYQVKSNFNPVSFRLNFNQIIILFSFKPQVIQNVA